MLDDSRGTREVSLDSGSVWKLGRSDKCAIVISDTAISRTHAMIQLTEAEEFYLIDMGSRNGSFVNDRRVSTPVVLHDGDRIALGQTHLVFHNPSQLPRGATPAPNTGATRVLFAQCLVSVLVVDIRNYTGLSNAIDQSLLCQVVGSWFGEADRIMEKHGCAGQKFIGDAVMAMWLHRSTSQPAEEIVRILRAVSEFARTTVSLQQRFELPRELRIGVGLNTGYAAVGNPGTHQTMDFTAIGDSVNAAFRLEAATKDLGTDLVLGKDTFDRLRLMSISDQYFRAHEVALKGYDGTAETWSTSFERLAEFLEALDKAADSSEA